MLSYSSGFIWFNTIHRFYFNFLLLLRYLPNAVNVYTASGYIEVDSDRADGKCEKWHMTEIKVKMDNITTKLLNLRYSFAIFLFPGQQYT